MRILLAADGSEGSLAAARLLAGLPLSAMTQIEILVVAQLGDSAARVVEIQQATRQALEGCGAGVSASQRSGNAADQILGAAEKEPFDLIVLGASGHSSVKRFLLGSVAERVARHAVAPVLLARPSHRPLRTVLLGSDGSPDGTLAAQWLRDFPLPHEAEVRVVSFMPNLESVLRARFILLPPLVEQVETLSEQQRDEITRQLNEMRAILESSGKRTVTEIRSGDAIVGLPRLAQEEAADLLVVGSRGQNAIERFLLGSVSDNVLRHAPCSVVIVHHAQRVSVPVVQPALA